MIKFTSFEAGKRQLHSVKTGGLERAVLQVGVAQVAGVQNAAVETAGVQNRLHEMTRRKITAHKTRFFHAGLIEAEPPEPLTAEALSLLDSIQYVFQGDRHDSIRLSSDLDNAVGAAVHLDHGTRDRFRIVGGQVDDERGDVRLGHLLVRPGAPAIQ